MNKYRLFIEGLNALSQFSGFHFVLKTGERAWLTPLPHEQRYHCCEFCKAVKQSSERMRILCNRHHAETALKEAVKRRKPFETTCHAGVTELVFPIITGNCRGALFAGPFLSSSGTGNLPGHLRELCHTMPKFSRSRMDSLAALLTALLTACEPETWQESPRTLLPPPDYNRLDSRMQKVIHYLHRNFRKPLRTDDVCKHIGLSRSRFIHCFTEMVGISFRDYLQRLRLSEAIQWIELTDLPLSAIAAECGFSDQSRFSAQFKRYYHLSPGEFRKKQTQK